MLPKFDYLSPASLDEATAVLARGGAQAHAGGTDLLGCLADGVLHPAIVVSLSRVPGLAGIRAEGDGSLRIGALTTLAEVAAHPLIGQRFQVLAEAAAAVASPQLRNQGTLGGNLCQKPRCWYYRGRFPCLRKGGEQCFAAEGQNQYHCVFGGERCFIVHPSDTAPALVALEAMARVQGSGTSRSVPVAALHVAPAQDPTRETVLERDELITEIVVPAPPAGLRSTYRKVRTRAAWDFALAGAAVALDLSSEAIASARIVLSGVAPVPWRARAAELALEGRHLDATSIAAAATAAVEGAEPLAHNAYKVPLIRGLVEDTLEDMIG